MALMFRQKADGSWEGYRPKEKKSAVPVFYPNDELVVPPKARSRRSEPESQDSSEAAKDEEA